MTYLVMECHPAYAVVLDQAGRMIKVANIGYEVGQKVDYVIIQQTQPRPVWLRMAPLVAAACLCLAVLGGGAYGACFAPYGTVRLTINPDVLMTVSYMDKVVGLEGLNDDGARLIDQLSYKGKNTEEITDILVERAMDMGYLTDGGTVSVTAGGSRRWKDRRETAIRTSLNNMLEGRVSVEIKVGDDDGGNASGGSDSNIPPHSVQETAPASRPAAAPVIPAGPGDMKGEPDRDDDDDDHDDAHGRQDGDRDDDDDGRDDDRDDDDGDSDDIKDHDDSDEDSRRHSDDDDDSDDDREYTPQKSGWAGSEPGTAGSENIMNSYRDSDDDSQDDIDDDDDSDDDRSDRDDGSEEEDDSEDDRDSDEDDDD